MQESSENNTKKVNKKVSNSNSKMSNSSQKVATNPTPETYKEPQNVRLDTSESDEESVSEVMKLLQLGLRVLRLG